MKKLLSALLALSWLAAPIVHAQNAITLPIAAAAVADIGNGPIKVRVTQGNASIFTSQGSATALTLNGGTGLVLGAKPATAPIVGGLISGTGITSGTTVTAYDGVTSLTLSLAATIPGGTTVSWGAACPASAAGIPAQFIPGSILADYYLLYTQARICAISPGGPANTLLILPVFYDQTSPSASSSSSSSGGGGSAVSSVFGRTGAVVAINGDYSVGQVTNALTNILNSGLFYVGSAGNVATGVAMGGDCTLVAAGTVTCTKTNGVSFAPSATTDTTNAGNISSGTLGTGRLSGSYTGITGVGALGAGSLAAGFTPVSIGLGGTGQTTQQAGFEALAPTATVAGSIIYWNGTHYVKLDGNNAGTKVLQEDNTGAPSWASVGSGTVTSVQIAAATGLTLSGTCTITTSGTCTEAVDIATSLTLLAGTAGKILDASVIFQGETTTTFNATQSLDFNTFNNTKITLTANITSFSCSNQKASQSGTIRFIQGGAGSFTLPATFGCNMKFQNGLQPVLSTAVGAVDALTYSCSATNYCVANMLYNVQ
jgi:hypothetical protein